MLFLVDLIKFQQFFKAKINKNLQPDGNYAKWLTSSIFKR